MKLSILLAFAILIFTGFKMYAQSNTGKIAGKIRGIQNKPLTGTTIKLINSADSVLKKTAIADKNGTFVFKNLPDGTYTISCSNIGFQPVSIYHLILDPAHPSITLPLIILQPAARQMLKEVTITAKKPLMEQKIDRTIINVDGMITGAGSNALEVLQKSPGVMVGPNDDISLNGKPNVLVLIDDRPTYMSPQDLAAYLRSLPGGIMDKLELISNPPARYDASGGAIINIVLKKNRMSGFNGGIILGYNQGKFARTIDALNLNYRTPNFNIFSNLSYGHDQNYSKETYNRYFYNADGSLNSAVLQHSNYDYSSKGWNGRIGLDYILSAKTTIGIILSGNTRPKADRLDYTNRQYNGSMQLDSTGIGYTSGQYQSKNAGVNLNLLHKFNAAGRAVTADVDYIKYNSSSSQLSPVATYLADGSLKDNRQRVFTFPSDVNIYAAKMDYTHPLPGKAEFDAGLKSSYVVTDNQSNWFNQQGDALLSDYSQSNHFRYAENINSAYVNFKKEWKRWAAQAGMRLENTIASGHQFSNPATADSSFTKRYSSLFPSLYVLYKLDCAGNNDLVLSYAKRIRRPGYQQLNPFLFYRDQYSYTSGNPNLAPNYYQFIELRYNWKSYFGVTLGYRQGSGEINPVTRAEGDVFISRPQNFINSHSYSLIPYFSLDPTRWWMLHINAVLLYFLNKGNADGIVIDQKVNLHEIEISNELKFSKTWSAELDGFFPGKQTFGQSEGGAIYNISGGVQKTIIGGNGTFRINVNDIFRTMNGHSQTIGIARVSAFSTRETDTRRVGFSFTYRFGKAANARKRNNAGSAEDEKGRTN